MVASDMRFIPAIRSCIQTGALCSGLVAPAVQAQQFSDGTAYGNFLRFNEAPEILFLVAPIEEGDFFELRKAMRDQPTKLIVTHSPGGSVYEALQLATAIHDNELATFIPPDAQCFSACAYVYFGGTKRAAEGELGVHQFFAGKEASGDQVDLNIGLRTAQYTTSEIIGFLNEFGTPPFVYEKMFSTESMYYFTIEERQRLALEAEDDEFSELKKVAAATFARIKAELPQSQPTSEGQTPTTPSTFFSALEKKALGLLVGINADWSQPNDHAFRRLPNYYAATVDFYGNMLPNLEVMQEKLTFAQRWPIRKYRVDPKSVEISCTADGCIVESVIDWTAASPERGAHSAGRSTWNLVLVNVGGDMKIRAENGKVLTRN